MCTSCSDCQSPTVNSKNEKVHYLSRFARDRPELDLFLCDQDELLRHQMWWVIRIVAMSAMTKNNPTMRTLMKVTMPMKTTMTTVQIRVLWLVSSCFPFPLCNLVVFRVFFGLSDIVAASLIGLYDFV